MKFTEIMTADIKEATTIAAIIAVIANIEKFVTYDIAGASEYGDAVTAIAFTKAIRMGEFDKVMFEYPAKAKEFLANHGWDWDMIDNCYDDRRWDGCDKCYYAKRTWHNAEKHGIQ